VTAGSSCIVNAYTSNHEAISAKDTSTGQRIVLHVTMRGAGALHCCCESRRCCCRSRHWCWSGH